MKGKEFVSTFGREKPTCFGGGAVFEALKHS